MNQSRKNRSNESGQVVLEFMFSVVFVIALILFLFQLTGILAVGSYIQYATYMGARAYLAGGSTEMEQRDRAEQYMGAYLNKGSKARFQIFAKPEGDGNVKGMTFNLEQFTLNDRQLSWAQGVRYTFKSKLMLPILGQVGGTSDPLEFKSESWLGREPSYQECLEMLQRWMGGKGAVIDNGC